MQEKHLNTKKIVRDKTQEINAFTDELLKPTNNMRQEKKKRKEKKNRDNPLKK